MISVISSILIALSIRNTYSITIRLKRVKKQRCLGQVISRRPPIREKLSLFKLNLKGIYRRRSKLKILGKVDLIANMGSNNYDRMFLFVLFYIIK